ncbi:Cyclic nucleotide-gated olfactory channel [Strongyloides ratti]|uniref:Cyclic nucleotide-gated olfactory channel n=1 Tax=Strongyloides ratti TaxID=34506 RepID=A0A090MXF4_STRRB|nr:Cyclic nucleotide-gated olfactory channel [Strongyloides ratti]CEF65339.1 Cyclic nucleotide-gated olfactory channel [Strongyloides ratti]
MDNKTLEEDKMHKRSFASVVYTTIIIKNFLKNIKKESNSDKMSNYHNDLVFNVQPSCSQTIFIDNKQNNVNEVIINDNIERKDTNQQIVRNISDLKIDIPIQTNEKKLIFFKFLKKIFKLSFYKNLLFETVNRSGDFYYFWTLFVSIACFYNLILMVVFVYDNVFGEVYKIWIYGNIICDIIFIIDIFIQSKISYLEDGTYVKNWKRIIKKYIYSISFILDILAIIPLDIFLIIKKELTYLRINRLLKCYRFNEYVERTSMRTGYPHAFKIFVLITICFILFHWNASVYYIISVFGGTNSEDRNDWAYTDVKNADPLYPTCDINIDDHIGDCGFNESDREANYTLKRETYVDEMMAYWKDKMYISKYSNFTKEYSLSFYWSSLTLTTCGQQPYPNAWQENILEVMDTIIGVLVFATIVGSVGALVSTGNRDKAEYQYLLDGIKFYMKYRNVEPLFQKRVIQFISYLYNEGGFTDDNKTLDFLPKRLQGQIAVNLHMQTLIGVNLFKDMEPGLLYALVLKLNRVMYAPDDFLCNIGDPAREMFILKRGKLQTVDINGVVLEILEEGSTFGETSIIKLHGKFNNDKQKLGLQSIGYSDVYILKRDDVIKILQDYPKERENLSYKIRQHFENNVEKNEKLDISDLGTTHSIEEQFEIMKKIIEELDKGITEAYDKFDISSSAIKKKVTRVEGMYKKSRFKIKEAYKNSLQSRF